MYKKIVSQAPLTLVTLAEVKAQSRVFIDFEDTYLESLILPYSQLAQSYTNRMLTVGVASAFLESYCPVQRLPFGEVTAITELLLDGEVSDDFTFNEITQKITINSAFNEAKMTFSAGYTVIPEVVKQAILISISSANIVRDDMVVGQIVTNLRRTSLDLLDTVRLNGD